MNEVRRGRPGSVAAAAAAALRLETLLALAPPMQCLATTFLLPEVMYSMAAMRVWPSRGAA